MTTAGTTGPIRGQVERWIPGVRVIHTYDRTWLTRDLIAGLVLVTLLVPQGMAYAELAGLPAITGLYTTVICLIAYALVGPSPILVLGPDSAFGPMIAATILPLAAGSEDQAIALAGMLALLVGAVTLGAGLLRLGFVADLLSNPVRTGYLAGLAVVILIGQLPALFGFSTDANGLVGEAVAFVEGIGMTNPWALGIGVLSLAIILGLRRLSPRMPGIFVAVVVAIVLSIVLDLAAHGVTVIGVLPQGFPVPGFPAAPVADIPLLFASAVGISLVAIGDTISVSGGFAARAGYEVDGNQELAGIGVGQSRRRPVLGLPGEHERLADRRGLPVGGEDPAHRPRRGGARDRDAPVRAGPRPGDAEAGARRRRHRSVNQPVRSRGAPPAVSHPQDRVRARDRLRARRHVRRRARGDRDRRRPVGRATSSSAPGLHIRRSSGRRRPSRASTTSCVIRVPSRSRAC